MLIGGSLETPWSPDREGATIEAEYQGAAAYATVGGRGSISLSIDGGEPETLQITGPELLELASHDSSGQHALTLTPDQGVEIWSLSFAPGPA